MNLLVAVADYPDNNGNVKLMYVHTRNIYYKKTGIDVTVLNFAAKNCYNYEGINVIDYSTYKKQSKKYSLLLCHASNLRNHYLFLKKYEKNFNKIIFFYHGHEVLKINKVYSKPYFYVSNSKIQYYLQEIYDSFKLFVWRKYLPKIKEKSYYIFVSNWMKEEFLKWVNLDESILEGRFSITYNNVGEIFEKKKFNEKTKKDYDFITIRNNLDGSKYAIDIVNKMAFNTPNKKFLVIGKGKFFDFNKKAPNITWISKSLSHEEIIFQLQKSKFALMPTRTDAQGLMMCEMAAFGIPVITSDIPVCHEVFERFENVYYINNEIDFNLNKFTDSMSKSLKHKKYYIHETVSKEVEIIKEVVK